MGSLTRGPLGNHCRFALLAATQTDRDSLRGLGTYGFIRRAAGFIVGALRPGPRDLEDYGYLMEQAVLAAVDLGLGTCWLGGTFTKSSFARRIGVETDETVPTVVATGYPAPTSRRHWIRRSAGSEHRMAPALLFFEKLPRGRLQPVRANEFSDVLETVRRAPSASNKQPWHLVRSGADWHFYLHRTQGYGQGAIASLIKMADLQRVDMGIAMCHFDLAARERGLSGRWSVEEPNLDVASRDWEYTATWSAAPPKAKTV